MRGWRLTKGHNPSPAHARCRSACAPSPFGRGKRGCFTARRITIQSSNSQASSPCFFAAPGTPSSDLETAAPGKEPRARGTPEVLRTHGPRRLATSRLVEFVSCRKSAKSQGVPRAVFVRFAPHRPRWTDRFRQPPFLPGDRLSTATGPDGRPALLTVPDARHQWGPVTRGLAGRDECGLDRRGKRHISDACLAPGHRSPPRVWRR